MAKKKAASAFGTFGSTFTFESSASVFGQSAPAKSEEASPSSFTLVGSSDDNNTLPGLDPADPFMAEVSAPENVEAAFTLSSGEVESTAADLSVEDGDVHLQTKDGVRFTAHVHMLKQSSKCFSERFPWHRMKDFTIILHQSSFAVRTLLSLIYPANERPMIATLAELIDVLDTAQAWQLTAISAREWLAARIAAEEHPLRSWALASSYGFRDAERQAIERYIKADSDSLDDIPAEMELADCRKMLLLIAAKRRALVSAQDALKALDWECPSCREQEQSPPVSSILSKGTSVVGSTSPPESIWRRDFCDRAMATNPFKVDASSDLAIEVVFTKHPPCNHPAASFWSTSARHAREQLRQKLGETLSAEVAKLI